MSILFIATYLLFNQSKTLIGHLLSTRHYSNSVNSAVLNNNKISTTHFKYNIHTTSFTHWSQTQISIKARQRGEWVNQVAVKENRLWWWGLCNQQDIFQVYKEFQPIVATLINKPRIAISPKFTREVGNLIYFVKFLDYEEYVTN